MKYLAIIQARCGSSRLPNKVLKNLNGKPAIMHVVERVKKSKYINEVIVATSIEKNNLPLIGICVQNGVRIFVGSENDVLDRYFQCAKLIKPEYIVRVTADCPMYDPNILDAAIEKLEQGTDYLNDFNDTLADGLNIEIVAFSALEEAHKKAKLLSEREHVTLYLKNHKEEYNVINFINPYGDMKNCRWTLDEDKDYEFLEKVFANFGDKEFYTSEIIEFLHKNPQVEKINNKFIRDEGLLISLRNDKEI